MCKSTVSRVSCCKTYNIVVNSILKHARLQLLAVCRSRLASGSTSKYDRWQLARNGVLQQIVPGQQTQMPLPGRRFLASAVGGCCDQGRSTTAVLVRLVGTTNTTNPRKKDTASTHATNHNLYPHHQNPHRPGLTLSIAPPTPPRTPLAPVACTTFTVRTAVTSNARKKRTKHKLLIVYTLPLRPRRRVRGRNHPQKWGACTDRFAPGSFSTHSWISRSSFFVSYTCRGGRWVHEGKQHAAASAGSKKRKGGRRRYERKGIIIAR